eukprot:g6286.t1
MNPRENNLHHALHLLQAPASAQVLAAEESARAAVAEARSMMLEERINAMEKAVAEAEASKFQLAKRLEDVLAKRVCSDMETKQNVKPQINDEEKEEVAIGGETESDQIMLLLSKQLAIMARGGNGKSQESKTDNQGTPEKEANRPCLTTPKISREDLEKMQNMKGDISCNDDDPESNDFGQQLSGVSADGSSSNLNSLATQRNLLNSPRNLYENATVSGGLCKGCVVC